MLSNLFLIHLFYSFKLFNYLFLIYLLSAFNLIYLTNSILQFIEIYHFLFYHLFFIYFIFLFLFKIFI